MNTEHVREWIQWLRSGWFEQGYERLKVVTSQRPEHCCLGVACDMLQERLQLKTGSSTSVSMRHDWEYVTTIHFEDTEDVLPYPVMEWLGINAMGDFQVDRELVGDDAPEIVRQVADGVLPMASLVELNDSEVVTFEQIADFLEYALEHPDAIRFKAPGWVNAV